MFEIAERLVAAGAQEIGFGDTTGMANPLQVRAFFAAARERLGDEVELTAHFHNTRGQGLANVLAALEAGLRELRVARSASSAAARSRRARPGNIATEDLVSMLHEMGIATGHRPRGADRRGARRPRRPRPPARVAHARRRPGGLARLRRVAWTR